MAGVAGLPGTSVCPSIEPMKEKNRRKTNKEHNRGKAREVILTSKPSPALPLMSLCRKAKKAEEPAQTPGMLHNTRTGTFFLECSMQLSSHVCASPHPPFE